MAILIGRRLAGVSGRGFDLDAAAYVRAVEAADGQILEPLVGRAINDFVVGCKADGIWSAIKASCILAGARTLAGALTPLKGAAPTNNNFVSGDYNRETGLVGNGTTKYLDSNRLSDADPQDNQHLAVYVSQGPTAGPFAAHIGTGGGNNGATVINAITGSTNTMTFRSRNVTANTGPAASASAVGAIAISRSSSAGYSRLISSAVTSITQASQAPINANTFVFATALTSATVISNTHSNCRLAFYSIGESLDLALLDTRVRSLITAIGAAIP